MITIRNVFFPAAHNVPLDLTNVFATFTEPPFQLKGTTSHTIDKLSDTTNVNHVNE